MNGEPMDKGVPGAYEVDRIPRRQDGTPKQFWYDPARPGRIIYHAGTTLREIYVGF